MTSPLCVLDCSVAISWCFEDEASVETDQILEHVSEVGAVVPNLWHLEVANVLLQAEKRKRIKEKDILSRVELLSSLPINVDLETCKKVFNSVLHVALREGLTSYDASYLELAMRLNLPLATKDRALQKASKNCGVELLVA